jgi:hypothetical protein
VQGVAITRWPPIAAALEVENAIRLSKKLNMYTLRHSRFGARRIAVLAAKWFLVSNLEARDELNLAGSR